MRTQVSDRARSGAIQFGSDPPAMCRDRIDSISAAP
jgi:hypothetical protein